MESKESDKTWVNINEHLVYKMMMYYVVET